MLAAFSGAQSVDHARRGAPSPEGFITPTASAAESRSSALAACRRKPEAPFHLAPTVGFDDDMHWHHATARCQRPPDCRSGALAAIADVGWTCRRTGR